MSRTVIAFKRTSLHQACTIMMQFRCMTRHLVAVIAWRAMAGAVAVGTVERWTGVYNDKGSEPGSLGRALWALLVGLHERGEGLEELRFKMERFGRWEVIAKEEGLTADPVVDKTPIRVLSSVADPSFVVWVYVVNPDARTLTVLTSTGEWEEPARYRAVAVVPLPPAPEPRWGEVG